LLFIDAFLARTYAIIASEVMYLGLTTLPKSRWLITFLKLILLILVITLALETSLAKRVRKIFSSSIPVSGTKDSTYSIPSSFRSSSLVPSPLIIIAFGRSMLSSSHLLILL